MHVSVMYEATVPHSLRYKYKGPVAEKNRTKIIHVCVPLGMQTSGLLQTVNYLERHDTTACEQEAAT